MKLNLGCGSKMRQDYVNVDCCGTPDVVCDLSVFPWPWADESVDEVYSEHFLEHVQDYEKTILEIHRILKHGGEICFTVPHYRSPNSIWHMHKWQFSVHTPEWLCLAIPYQWGGVQLFEKVSLKVSVPCPIRCLNGLLNKLASNQAIRWDRWGLPIMEIEFRGRKC